MQDGSHLFQLHIDASTDGIGAVSDQPQLGSPVRPILYSSRATLSNETNCNSLESEGGVITSAIKRLRQYLLHAPFYILVDRDALEQLAKVGEQNPRVQSWLQFLTPYQFTVKHRPVKNDGNAHLLSLLPQPPRAAKSSLPLEWTS